MKFKLTLLSAILICMSCNNKEVALQETAYYDYSTSDSKFTGGTKIIPIETALGTFNVWTKRVGNNPTTKVLLLHGGPGATSEYFEAADSYFPQGNVEYYY